MRRWEDWERSRLRKLKREERRRREMERAHGGFIQGDREFLAPDRSQLDWSDSQSVASSDDDHWGTQIGAYNEHSTQYPPPPTAFIPRGEALQNAETVGAAELEAMLETGFDVQDPVAVSPRASTYIAKYQLTDGSTPQLANVHGNGYSPLTRSASPGSANNPLYNPLLPSSTPSSESGHSRPPPPFRQVSTRPPPAYGPLGPLDPSSRF
jgi:chitin synthase